MKLGVNLNLAELGVILITVLIMTGAIVHPTRRVSSFKFTPSFIAYYLFQDREFLYQISFSFTVLSLCTSETFLKL